MEIDVELSKDFNRDLIGPAMINDVLGTTVDDIEQSVLNGSMEYWAISNGSLLAGAVTSISENCGHRILAIVALGGKEIDQWFDEFLYTMEDYGELTKCERMVVYGRKGWVKKGLSRGWDYAFTAMKKEI